MRAGGHTEGIWTDQAADTSEGIVAHHLSRGTFDIRWISTSSRHDEVEGRAISGTGYLAWLFLAILAPEEFRLELTIGHQELVTVSIILHQGTFLFPQPIECNPTQRTSRGHPAGKKLLA